MVSFFELFFQPNLTGTTFVGLFLIIGGILLLFFNNKVFKPLGLKTTGQFISAGLIVVGLILVFVVSFFQDLFSDPNLILGFIALIVIVVTYLFLFRNQPKKGRKRK